MKSKKKLSLLTLVGAASVALGFASVGNQAQLSLANARMFKANTEDTFELTNDNCYAEGYDVDVKIGGEGSVLLKNENNILPLAEKTKVTLLGAMSYNYVEGGTGSAGGNDDENTVMMSDAFEEAGLDVNDSAWNWLAQQCGGKRGVDSTDPDGAGWTSYTKIHEFDKATYEGAKSSIVTAGYSDYAIVTFSRSGAEGASPSMDYDGDGSTLTGSTYLELDQDEKDVLAFAKANFKHTIVLINSATPMELGFIDSTNYNVEAALWIGHPGEAGIVGVGTILTGRTNPSGNLVDTYAYDMTTNPTYYNTDDNRYTNGQTFYQYEEGIYVGYRYYETADSTGYFDSSDFTSHKFKNGAATGYNQVVQFPFGYGLSYTTFSQKVTSSNVKLEAHGTNSITVEVKNEGSVAGKETVQVYMEAPYNQDSALGISGKGLEKSKVVLVGYAKTEEIAAGGTATVTVNFDTDDLASFDNFGKGCYVLEKGEYKFNIQNNAHCWADSGENAYYGQVKASLDASIVYDETGVGKRASDKIVAKNAMDDVTAGDGNMLDGYLSRSNFAAGMTAIMKHTSDETANEVLDANIEKCLNLKGTESADYTFKTYKNGVKTEVTKKIYAHGADMMPFSTATPEGTAASTFTNPNWGKKYYVLENEDGTVKANEDGTFDVLDAAPSDGSKYHQLTVNDMVNVDISTDAGLAIWDKLTEETTIKEAIEIQGNSGWQISAIDSVGKPQEKTVDGPGEVANGTMAGATWFNCAVSVAATWNVDLAKAYGVAYGHQAVLFGVTSGYCPAMNIHRSPFGGRNFEYYSEDGFLSGQAGGNAIAGMQSTGTKVFAKHCALNDGDTNRGGNTTWANEQAVREIYLKDYEIACKNYAASGIMGSLNRIGMTWFHYGMYTTIMRHEWGWQGMLITDGDGSSGDNYNNSPAMLSIQGSMLNRGCYINDRSTVAAFGDTTSYAYGQFMLHEVMRNCLWHYAGAGKISEAATNNDTSSKGCFGSIAVATSTLGALGLVGSALVIKKKEDDAE